MRPTCPAGPEQGVWTSKMRSSQVASVQSLCKGILKCHHYLLHKAPKTLLCCPILAKFTFDYEAV